MRAWLSECEGDVDSLPHNGVEREACARSTRFAGPTVADDSDKGHVVTVEVLSVTHGFPVGILELRIVPKPLVIDRTFRFYHAERALMRQTIRIRHLPGADTAFAGGLLRTLAVAASHPDVITGVGSMGLAGAGGDRDEVGPRRVACRALPLTTRDALDAMMSDNLRWRSRRCTSSTSAGRRRR